MSEYIVSLTLRPDADTGSIDSRDAIFVTLTRLRVSVSLIFASSPALSHRRFRADRLKLFSFLSPRAIFFL
ncbi:MAG: hypothetical protein KC519_20915, partial [Anaerolineae bacterium]|nr:hypothetical protein [Anaerolineae bacterium]